MKNKTRRSCRLLLVVLTIVVLCSSTISYAETEPSAAEIVDKMTLRQKIGQMIMPDFRNWTTGTGEENVTTLNDDIRKIIRDYDFGGVILFAENVKGTEQTTRLTNDLQQTAIEDKNIPLLISIDQEGGRVARLGTGTSLPGNMALGATRDKDLAYDAGAILGSELNSLGINVNFAPSADVNSNPSNPVIGERSFGSKPELVSEMVVPLLKGIQSNNVAAVVKHFPGHGDTEVDSHVGLALTNKTYEQLKAFELLPFQAAVDAGTDMIMTAHIQMPQIETETAISKKDNTTINIPATLSKAAIQGIIRDKMKYEGVVVTDAMNMAAIADNFGEADAVIRAIKADVDICLMPTSLRKPSDISKLERIYETIENAVASKEISMEMIDDSVERIIELKIKKQIIDPDNYKVPLDQQIATAKENVGSADHHKRERNISQKAITVVKNDNNLLPMKPNANDKILMVSPYANEEPSLQYGLRRLMRESVVSDKVQYDTVNYKEMEDLSQLQEKLEWADRIIVLTEITKAENLQKTAWQTAIPLKLTDYAKEKNKPMVLMSIGKPYDAVAFPDAQAMVVAYGFKGMDPIEGDQEPTTTYGPNIPAALDIIFGVTQATGKLPVDAYALNEDGTYSDQISLPFGYGLQYPQIDQIKTIENQTYTGKALTPKVSVTDKLGKAVNAKNFNVAYKNNTKIGAASVTVTASQEGSYIGSAKKEFKIKPAKGVVSSLKTKSNKITATAKKLSGGVKYEFAYKMAGGDYKTCKTSATTKTFTGLKKGKVYAVKVRGYKAVNGVNYYGAYSSSKTVKVR